MLGLTLGETKHTFDIKLKNKTQGKINNWLGVNKTKHIQTNDVADGGPELGVNIA